jgi:hypothetical protein
MAKASIFGTMDQCMTVNGMKIRSTVKEFMCGQMAESLMENGKTITCMEEAFILGKMVGGTKVNT